MFNSNLFILYYEYISGNIFMLFIKYKLIYSSATIFLKEISLLLLLFYFFLNN